MHRQKIKRAANESKNEMQFTQAFVIHATGEFWEPMIDGSENTKGNHIKNHVMEMADNKISIAHMDIHRHRRQHHTGYAGKNKVEQPRQAKQHRR